MYPLPHPDFDYDPSALPRLRLDSLVADYYNIANKARDIEKYRLRYSSRQERDGETSVERDPSHRR